MLKISNIALLFGRRSKQFQSRNGRFLGNGSNLTLIILLFIIIVSGFFWLNNRTDIIDNFELSSPSFNEGGKLPSQFTCDGEGVSPELNISQIPEEAKTLAIIFEEIDIDRNQYNNSPYLAQQMVWNIPADVKKFEQGIRPPGTMGRTLSGGYNYDAPCPPNNKAHQYRFTIYALKTNSLTVGADAGIEELKKAISQAEISKDELNVSYTRTNRKK